jgi:hypothetical protein
MAWYKEKYEDEIIVAKTSVNIRPSYGLKKEASSRSHSINFNTESGSYNTKAHTIGFNDTMSSDSYRCDVHLTESRSRIVLSVVFMNNVHSFPLYSEAWKYSKDESKKAMKTYNKCVNLVEDLKVECEFEEIPGPVLQAMARSTFRNVDKDRKHITPSRYLEAEKDLTVETDWRSSIYGNRLPSQQGHPLTPPIVDFNKTNGE